MKRYSPLFFAVVFSSLVVFALGCGKNNPKPEDEIVDAFSPPSDQISRINEHIFSSASISADRGDYLIGSGDLLEIRVFEAEKLNTTVRVSSRGIVSLPLLREISLDGLTAREAESRIEDEYKKSYIKDPHISIFVKEHYSQRVTVIGQVKNPGTYDYPSRQKLLAGGLTDKAGRTIQVRRMSGASAASQDLNQTLLVNLDKLINEGQSELNISINGGDIIFIPEAGVLWADTDAYLGDARGTFINRNHFAGFVEMVWPLGLGLILVLEFWLASSVPEALYNFTSARLNIRVETNVKKSMLMISHFRRRMTSI